MKKKFLFGVLVLLFIVSSVLYAQNNATLDSGVYQVSNGGRGMIVITGSGNSRNIILRNNEGKIAGRGTIRIIGTRINFSSETGEFEVWAILDNDSFATSEGFIWYRVRNWRNSDLQ
ncbi:MAG: hypothetical protein LBC52_05785 [Treponema sp.]|jgi:hypothetical protein|nr:hypothetical protein [Treponema sp.]